VWQNWGQANELTKEVGIFGLVGTAMAGILSKPDLLALPGNAVAISRFHE
jgi:hypothetical protein